uniref:TNFR-Cys domain-containing protein n=1 Tax=Gadus morhua TaxID=8049 RepID=A0A8C5BQ69_GADMO
VCSCMAMNIWQPNTASPSCASDEYRAGQLCCLACTRGYRVHRDCTATANTLCSKCPDGTFKEGLSGQKQCSACTKCVRGQEVKKFCTPTSDTECEIPDGFFCSESFFMISSTKSIGKQHTLTCSPTGYRVHRDCSATTNTKCTKCPDGTFKEGLSGQKQCSNCTECVRGTSILLNGNAPHATPICCGDENVALSMFVSEVVLFIQQIKTHSQRPHCHANPTRCKWSSLNNLYIKYNNGC